MLIPDRRIKNHCSFKHNGYTCYRKIRGLYLAKYAALSVIGTVIGLALSFPFGEMLMRLFSKSIIINNQNAAFASVLCAVLMVGVIMLFCYGCTSKVGKMSPINH